MINDAPGAPRNLLTLLTSGDWLKIPGAVKAIDHLVTGIADAGGAFVGIAKAKAEQRQQAIRDNTAARTAVTKALTKSAVKQAEQDPELTGRALNSWIGRTLRQQANKEVVARLTVEEIECGPAVPPDTEGPSDDWMNVFEPYVGQASSERLQQTWARILAGEIRKPGSFSLRTLVFISMLDQSTATDIIFASGAVVDFELIPLLGKFNEAHGYSTLIRLAEIGFLTMGSESDFSAASDGTTCLRIGPNRVFEFIANPSTRFSLGGGVLSRVGKEMLSVLSIAEDEDQIAAILHRILENKEFRHTGTQLAATAI